MKAFETLLAAICRSGPPSHIRTSVIASLLEFTRSFPAAAQSSRDAYLPSTLLLYVGLALHQPGCRNSDLQFRIGYRQEVKAMSLGLSF